MIRIASSRLPTRKHARAQKPRWLSFLCYFCRPAQPTSQLVALAHHRHSRSAGSSVPGAARLLVCFKLQDIVQETKQLIYLVDGQRIHLTHYLTCIDRTGKGSPLRLPPSSGRRSWSGRKRGGSTASSSQTKPVKLRPKNTTAFVKSRMAVLGGDIARANLDKNPDAGRLPATRVTWSSRTNRDGESKRTVRERGLACARGD